MRDQDQQFFDSFMLVIGILMGVMVGLFFLAQRIATDTQGQYVAADPRVRAEIDARIAPVGHVVLLGDEALAEARQAAMAAPTPVDMPLTGAQVVNQQCLVCHGPPGVGGAPVVGDAAAWADRVAQGVDLLNERALNGYTGNAGYMPPKGGFAQLSDQEVIEAVQYMVDQVQQNGSAPAAQ